MVMCDIDDTIFAPETTDDHLLRLREVFLCMRAAVFKGIYLVFMNAAAKNCGKTITSAGINPEEARIEIMAQIFPV